MIPIVILIVISFPPLFGHEIVALLCGVVYGLWIGFGVVAAGTFIGESKLPSSLPSHFQVVPFSKSTVSTAVADKETSWNLVRIPVFPPQKSRKARADKPQLWGAGASDS